MSNTGSKNIYPLVAWVVMLLISLLPDILFHELTGSRPAWLYWAQVGLIGALLLVSLFWKKLRPVCLTLCWGSAWPLSRAG